MSLKDDVNYVKNELSSEEKFLESFVKVERFYKKYKALVIAIVLIFVVAIVGYFVTKSIQESNKIEANNAFNKILKDPKDSVALATLKNKNEKLYQVAQYIQAKKEGKSSAINVKYLQDLAAYEKALNSKDITALNEISMRSDFLLKEFAIFNKALILTEQGKYKKAKAALKLIPADSKTAELVNVLKHYLVTK